MEEFENMEPEDRTWMLNKDIKKFEIVVIYEKGYLILLILK